MFILELSNFSVPHTTFDADLRHEISRIEPFVPINVIDAPAPEKQLFDQSFLNSRKLHNATLLSSTLLLMRTSAIAQTHLHFSYKFKHESVNILSANYFSKGSIAVHKI